MKEFSFIFKEHFTRGLQPIETPGRLSRDFRTLQNLRVTESGLAEWPAMLAPLAELDHAFPFPQLLTGRSRVMLAQEDSLALLNGDFEPAALTVKSLADGETVEIAANGEAYELVDLGDAYALFNGGAVLFHDASCTALTVKTNPAMLVQSGCHFRGRMIYCGFGDGSAPIDSAFFDDMLDTNWVAWSPIGAAGFWDLYGTYLPAATKAALVDEYRLRNELGAMPMPWQGYARRVMPLGNRLVVYGDNGIALLVPAAEPMPTFGLFQIAGFGIHSRMAVCGDEFNQMFIAADGTLCSVSSENYSIRRLGYRSIFKDWTTAVGSFDPIERDYTFSNGTTSFVYANGGLSERTIGIGSQARIDSQLYGVVFQGE